jgi:addiction module RelE/StbE family toxin
LTSNLETHRTKSKKAFLGALELFVEDPNLRNSALKAKFAGLRSIDITDDWRALYRWEDQRIIFVRIGTHDELYGENS